MKAASVTGAETVAASVLCLIVAPIVGAYVADWSGLTIVPAQILVLSLAASAITFTWLRRHAVWDWPELAVFSAVVAGVFAWLLWRAWPSLLPLGGGPDLTHHLLLVDYIERSWHLVHDAQVEARLGEMVHYTPGSHLLAALAGAWSSTDGLHAIHTVLAACAALKVGFVYLVTLRVLPADVPGRPLALTSVLLLVRPQSYVLGSFEDDSFHAQVVSELFAVGMWWTLVVWDARPWRGAAVLFAVAGSAVFLTWPVWIGPPLVVLLILTVVRTEIPAGERLVQMTFGVAPIAVVAAMHVAGRLRWLGIVRTSGAVVQPSVSELGWLFLLLSAIGMCLIATRPRGRATALLVAAIAAQAAALFVTAKAAGATTPYMAFKMSYLAVYPLAVAAAATLATIWLAIGRVAGQPALLRGFAEERLAWAVVLAVALAITRPVAARPIPTPVVSEPLYLAGQWARANLPPECVDYLVSDADTAYWLHLAVLGNPRMSPRSAEDATYEPREAMRRWIEPGGLSFAIADLTILPQEIRETVDVLAVRGTAAVLKRRGNSRCPEPATAQR